MVIDRKAHPKVRDEVLFKARRTEAEHNQIVLVLPVSDDLNQTSASFRPQLIASLMT